ncbi:hypothetical protein FQN52_005104 [Onygenales sp. PD_12]|nr:hypothetical protein FQN52_005104 [Onygenales sp. PD_12]KAK2799624.1 hypothetical protein FQN51_006756 [Onygenales sp. PD_10]
MAEYWKSTPKYWCKHCKTYVRDTAFERTQHEATGKHQGALKRFLRDIHRGHERDERENQRAKSEVERLSRLVSSSGSGSAASGEGSTAGTGQGAPPPWKKRGTAIGTATATATGANAETRAVSAAERKKQMAQLVEMGVAIPEEFRAEMALVGDWKVVEEVPKGDDGVETAGLNIGVRKRKFEGQEEEEAAGEMVVRRGWGSTVKEFPGKDGGDDEDLDRLLEMTRGLKKREKGVKKEEVGEGEVEVKRERDSFGEDGGDMVAAKKEEDEPTAGVKREEDGEGVSKLIPEAPQDMAEETVPAVVFKKRKPKHAR